MVEGNREDFLEEVFYRGPRLRVPLHSIFKARGIALKQRQYKGFRLDTKGDCLAVAVDKIP